MNAKAVSTASAEPAPAPTFEGAMERLEALVERMENARLPLEDLIHCYEEGTRLVKTCTDQLTAVEQRIEIIARDAAGQPRPVPFDPASAASSESPKTKTTLAKAAAPPPAAAVRDNEVSLF